ncbi:MAG: metal ABC transporter permease [Clostridium sp.]|nr:metal ABC transporter permease [Clostridium sp.]
MLSLLNDYTFRIVVIGAMSLGILSGLTGSFMVLRKQSLLADAISHAALAGIALGYLVTFSKQTEFLLVGALIIGLISVGLIILISRFTKTTFESSMALVMTMFFGLGLVLLTYIQKLPNSNQAGLDRFIYGQVATMLKSDVYLILGATIITLFVIVLLFKELQVFTFDPDYGTQLGFSEKILNVFISLMTVLTIILGIQSVGVVLMSALLIAPAVSARQWTNSLKVMLILASIFGAFSGLLGTITSSLIENMPTGPTIVMYASIIVIISLFFSPKRGILWKSIKKNQYKKDYTADMMLISYLTHINKALNFTFYDFKNSLLNDTNLSNKNFNKNVDNLKRRNLIKIDRNKKVTVKEDFINLYEFYDIANKEDTI